jgi:hypothetical protein
LAWDLTDRGASQKKRCTVLVESKAQYGALQAIRNVCVQEQALRADVVGPEETNVAVRIVDLDGHA